MPEENKVAVDQQEINDYNEYIKQVERQITESNEELKNIGGDHGQK